MNIALSFCCLALVLLGTSNGLKSCQRSRDCPKNAVCVWFSGKDQCACKSGFLEKNDKCVQRDDAKKPDDDDDDDDDFEYDTDEYETYEEDGEDDDKEENGEDGDGEDDSDYEYYDDTTTTDVTTTDVSTTTPEETTTTTSTTTTKATTTTEFEKPDLAIRVKKVENGSKDYNDTVTRCPGLYLSPSPGSNFCYHGGKCLRDKDARKSYCVCNKNFGGRFCNHRIQRSKGRQGSMKKNRKIAITNGKRYQHKRIHDISTFARYNAKSISKCISMCKKAGNNCKSVNFGRVGNRNICEMLQVRVRRRQRIYKWLVDKPGWKFACCMS